MTPSLKGLSILQRLEIVTDRSGGEDSCWTFNRVLSGNGYAYLWIGKGLVGVHVLSYIETYGAIPEGKVVRHKCDNPPCSNPKHLMLGSHAENTQDKIARNRQARPRGESNPSAKLDENCIREIRSRRAEGETISNLAQYFSVSETQIGRIVSGEHWPHVLPEGVAV